MTLLGPRTNGGPAGRGTPAREAAAPTLPARPDSPPAGPAAWARDLMMGLRFAAGGGREGWIRTVLTAVGVGLGVAVLFLGASVPSLLDSWHGREKARENLGQAHEPRPADNTLLYAHADTRYHHQNIRGRLVRPDGTHPPKPPGIAGLPRPGTMLVSPALKELLDSSGGRALRERLPYRVVGTIGDEGLQGPAELTYLAGSSALTERSGAYRIDHFGLEFVQRPMRAPAVVLVIMTCVALLTPVMVFIGTSVRFGNERREQRLAALRLVGSDIRTTRRIAAGETLLGSLAGLVLGAGFFLGGRQLASVVTLWDINVFPSDIVPDPLLALLIAVLVPAAAVLVTLFAQRGVTAEPLGVVRHRPPVRRRLWWRPLVPLAGAGLLATVSRGVGRVDTPLNTIRLATGATLLLLGVTALLPWLVDAVVRRLRGGPVPWQLATRRLQLNSGAATRAVAGITVAVAGAIAVHMTFTGMQAGFAESYARNGRPVVEMTGGTDGWPQIRRALTRLRGTEGVRTAGGTIESSVSAAGDRGRFMEGSDYRMADSVFATVGDCAELARIAELGACRDGDVFITSNLEDRPFVKPGARLNLDPPEGVGPVRPPQLWTLPATARVVHAKADEDGLPTHGILITPSAVDTGRMHRPLMHLSVRYDPATPDAVEHIRTTAARIDPTLGVISLAENRHDGQYDSLRTGLFIGAVVTLLLIGAGLVISTVEQLYEHRRLLSALDAFGTRRATLGWSVLWQTAIPVVLGLLLAVGGGLALGTLLLSMIDSAVFVDWPVVAGMAGAGAAVILLVTVLSLPPLWRMMRPDGLRTE
ncbi:integral membrane protein [Streptomyces griseoflavus]|uniref:ABC transporter permease n=1 Tax=Streptomyces rimosus TaxID=1927 RepID=UPI0004C7911A|nr:FtsX-like permease family protein [Streptomyces rimosus]KOG64960.1 integral membrane protein [Streptomyces griseoflavus]